MSPVPTVSPVTGQRVPAHYVHSSSAFFRDTAGRHLLLRGVNLSGSSKAPLPQPSQSLDDFWEAAEAGGESFVGQPLRLDDGSADVHLARLKGWGFNMLRYVVTWESLEREGPGKYDEEFMDYTIEVLRKCKEYGFRVFMDPHQDVWSRFSGGSGAPYWTLPACGFNPRNFTVTAGAFIHAEYPSPDAPDPASFPAMIWGTNYARLVSQTIFTLFFGGRDFAPKCIIDGINIQDWLQQHYNAAMMRLADRIREAGDLLDECVIGWDSLNEPAEGMIGLADLGSLPKSQALKKGPTPTAFEGFRLGMGEAVTVDNWNFTAMGPAKSGTVTIDPKGKTCWLAPEAEANGSRWGWKRDPGWRLGTCIWALHGVWDPSTRTLLRRDYFATVPSAPSGSAKLISFVPDYWRPTWVIWARAVRKAHPEAIHFIQPPVFHQPPQLDETELCGRACSSPHWYDGLTLLTRHWNWFNADALGMLRGKYFNVIQSIRIGEGNIRKCFQDQFGVLKQDTFDILGQYPTLIGECGIPFDLDDKVAYGYQDGGKGRGDYTIHQRALDATLNASDGDNVINYTVWTYCVDNSHQWGDNWNLEDLSLWSPDDTKAGAPENGHNMVEHVAPAETVIARPDFARSLSTQRLTSPSEASGLDAVSSAPTPANGTAGQRPLGERFDLDRDILTNGSRAVGACSRPFPVATFGVPKRLDFDIHAASFKMTVEVSAGDVADERTPTEIYLPWVHFASEAGFSTGSERTVYKGDARSGVRPRASSSGSSFDSQRSGSPASTLVGKANGSGGQRKEGTVRIEDLSDASSASETLGSGSGQMTASLPPFELDLEVIVSSGRFEVQGQTLRWWYGGPTAASRPTTYTITAKRRGGARKEMAHPRGQASALWNMKALLFSWLASLWALCKTIVRPHRQKKFALEGDESERKPAAPHMQQRRGRP